MRATEHSADFLPVWVFVDADTPVVNAPVRVDTEGLGHLHESNGRSVALTNENGLVVLEFETLPRSFTVIALGGDAEGRRLGRTAELRAEVGRSEPDTIVYINPVTTLAERLLKLFDLSRGEIYDHCPFGERGKCPYRYSENTPLPSEERFLMHQSALVIYKRPLGSQESYWF